VKLLAETHLIDPMEYLSVEIAEYIFVFANSVVFAIITYVVVLAVVRLKSFIWNIYQGFLTFLVVNDLMNREAPGPDDPRP
jgi:hypothetical protein